MQVTLEMEALNAQQMANQRCNWSQPAQTVLREHAHTSMSSAYVGQMDASLSHVQASRRAGGALGAAGH